MTTIPVDRKITLDFFNGDLTAKAYKAYLSEVLFKAEGIVIIDEPSFLDKAQVIASAQPAVNLTKWERIFLTENLNNLTPTSLQTEMMDKLWRRFTG